MADDQGSRTEIGPETLVTGDVRADEDIVVFGRIDGTVSSTTTVIVEDGGRVGSRIEAPTVIVAGWASGDVIGTERVEITESGRVLGNVYAPRLVLLEGGAVKGRVVMDGSRPDSTQAPAPTRTVTARPVASQSGTAARRSTVPASRTVREPVSATRAKAAAAPAPRAPANPGLLDLGDDGEPKVD
jgi:cytoskeletal protein CcmA (bactofilin family)